MPTHTDKPAIPAWPSPPNEYLFKKRKERVYLYEVTESFREDDDEYYDDEDERPKKPEKPVHKVDLGWLLSKLPEGKTAKDVKIEFGYNASSMAYEDHYLRFYYEVDVPGDPKGLKKAKAEYAKKKAQYDKDMAAYQEAVVQQQIREKEEELARLKANKK